MSLTVC